MNAEHGNNHPMNFISDFIIYNKYASHKPQLGRRQTWNEAVGELEQMQMQRYPGLVDEIAENFKYVYNKIVMPSMRSIQYGGRPIELNNSRIYNCCYSPQDHPYTFAETAFCTLSGNGYGYSIRKHHTKHLPIIVKPNGEQRFMIGDSVEGISDSYRALIYAYMYGRPLPRFDYRDIRPKGSLIKGTGSIAPGPKLIAEAHVKINKILKRFIGKRLTPLVVLDITNIIGGSIVEGGVREAAMISLCDKDEWDVITCKGIFQIHSAKVVMETNAGWMVKYKFVENQIMNTDTYEDPDSEGYFSVFMTNKWGDWDLQQALHHGQLPWYYVHPQRGKSNNSVALNRTTTIRDEFFEIMKRCKDSKAGEPGAWWCDEDDSGTNPCVETSLRRNQYCNLTTQNVYDIYSQEQLNKQSRAASFIGTLQAGWTDFHYLRPIWRKHTEEDALLGVSMTGIASGRILKHNLREAAGIVVDENKRVSSQIGINSAARTTCLKPEGSSTWVMKALGSGVHGIHDKHILKSFRLKKTSPVYQYLLGVLPSQFIEDEFNNEVDGAVIYVPLKSNANGTAIYRNEPMSQFLGRIKHFFNEWVMPGHVYGPNTHNVSATVSVHDDGWDELTEWMWENKTSYNGISCLPHSNHNYKQAPFQSIDESTYDNLVKDFPDNIDFSSIREEFGINHATDNIACGAGGCEI